MSTVSRGNPTATVIATQPGEVRVRLQDNAELPRWYPSLLADTAIGTEGTMLRGNQERMLFIPHGFDEIDAYTQAEVNALLPKADSAAASQTLTVAAAGDFTPSGSAVSISGLTTSRTYTCVGTVSVVLVNGGAEETARTGMTFTGLTSASPTTTTYTVDTTSSDHGFTYTARLQPTAGGVITLTPFVRWVAGSYNTVWASATLTVI